MSVACGHESFVFDHRTIGIPDYIFLQYPAFCLSRQITHIFHVTDLLYSRARQLSRSSCERAQATRHSSAHMFMSVVTIGSRAVVRYSNDCGLTGVAPCPEDGEVLPRRAAARALASSSGCLCTPHASPARPFPPHTPPRHQTGVGMGGPPMLMPVPVPVPFRGRLSLNGRGRAFGA